jgi:hypothetical protein
VFGCELGLCTRRECGCGGVSCVVERREEEEN